MTSKYETINAGSSTEPVFLLVDSEELRIICKVSSNPIGNSSTVAFSDYVKAEDSQYFVEFLKQHHISVFSIKAKNLHKATEFLLAAGAAVRMQKLISPISFDSNTDLLKFVREIPDNSRQYSMFAIFDFGNQPPSQ